MNCTLFHPECIQDTVAFLAGLVAGTFAWGWHIPQIVKAHKRQTLADFSYKGLSFTLTAHVLMVVYGALIYQIPILVNAPLAVITSTTLIVQKTYYCAKANADEPQPKS
jgi:uncharacterized protein with PQ loop repeat